MLYPDDAMRLAISRAVAIEGPRGWRIGKDKQAFKVDMIVALAMSAYAAVQAATWAASQAAVRGILAALLARGANGQGQWVQTSLLQNMIPYDLASLMMRQLSRLDPETFPPDSLGVSR